MYCVRIDGQRCPSVECMGYGWVRELFLLWLPAITVCPAPTLETELNPYPASTDGISEGPWDSADLGSLPGGGALNHSFSQSLPFTMIEDYLIPVEIGLYEGGVLVGTLLEHPKLDSDGDEQADIYSDGIPDWRDDAPFILMDGQCIEVKGVMALAYCAYVLGEAQILIQLSAVTSAPVRNSWLRSRFVFPSYWLTTRWILSLTRTTRRSNV